ncbi:MAG: type I restriction endonuclease subunit R [Candidatus Dormibacteria bacterium]
MRSFVAESGVEETCLEYFTELGWQALYGPDIAPGEEGAERESFQGVLLESRVRAAIKLLNPDLGPVAVDEVLAKLRRPESGDVLAENWRVYRLLTSGAPVEHRGADGETRHGLARLIDFERPERNDYLVVNQFRVEGDRTPRRPDLVVFVNGIPLGLIELKVPGEPRATLHGAYDQLRTYAAEIPALLAYNAVSVVSTGTQARVGPLSGAFEHFAAWKTIDGRSLARSDVPELEVTTRGVFEPGRFLDLVRNFVSFSDERTGMVKRLAKYHQFHAVNKAVASTVAAMERGDGRAGVVWHTQGSGKSLEMLFYVGKVMRHPAMANPTVLIVNDRNDLDDQLFDDTFAPARTLPEAPVQAASREHLRWLLSSRVSGGIVFSTMQKFGLGKEDREAGRAFPVLSDRSNIVVVADEAHRTQYDLLDGLARNLRDALPKASFMGFTGTPIETADRDTRTIFGEYIDVYDLTQAVEDGATVKVFYEARLAKVELPPEIKAQLDESFETVTERAETDDRERLKSRWARVEAIVGAKSRIEQVASDIVAHWEARRSAQVGKGLIVCMSRRICVELYDEVVRLQPDWHGDDDATGLIKVVITGSAADGPELNTHVRDKARLRELKNRAKDPGDLLELVIVRDMWLTGFDSPSLHTIYVDKPMRGAGLMQAIARVNRTFRDKPGGLVVDYIGIAEDLRSALADYTDRDRTRQEVGAPLDEALAVLEEGHEVCCDLLFGCPWREALESGSDRARLEAIMAALDHLIGGTEEGLPERFLRQERRARQAFTLAVSSPEAAAYRDDLSFFQAVAVELRRSLADTSGAPSDDAEVETALRQVVSDAVTTSGVIDIYAAAGIAQPDLALIDDGFAQRFATSPHPNLQIELLRRLLTDGIRSTSKRNVVSERRFSEMLERAMRAYNNRSLTAAEVIVELVDLAKQLREEQGRGAALGLRDDELAFYDAVCQNDAAVLQLGDQVLKQIAQDLVAVVRANTSVDWDRKEQVRALLRSKIRRLLTKYHYPPDKQEAAVQVVIEQAEALAAGEIYSAE